MTVEQTTVNGRKFNHWGDSIKRAEIAEDVETGEVKVIRYNGYLRNDLFLFVYIFVQRVKFYLTFSDICSTT